MLLSLNNWYWFNFNVDISNKLNYTDETLEFTNAQELEFALECQQALSNEEAQKLTSDGSMFDSAGELPSGGACPLEVARLSDVHSQIGGPGFSLPSGQQMLVDAPAADTAEAKAAAKKEATAAKAAAKKDHVKKEAEANKAKAAAEKAQAAAKKLSE